MDAGPTAAHVAHHAPEELPVTITPRQLADKDPAPLFYDLAAAG